MRAPIASAIVAVLATAIVLTAGDPFGAIAPRIGTAMADQGLADRIREREKEAEAEREQARTKNLQLEVERARIQQQDLALAIRSKEFDLEQERRRAAARELEVLKSRRETLEKRIEFARKTVLNSFDASDRGFIPDPQKLPKSLERSKRLRDTMVKRLLMFRGDSKNYIADGTALNFFLELCGSAAFSGQFYRAAAGRGGAGAETEWLGGLTDRYRLSPEILREIRYQRGLSGPRLSGRLNEDPLDTNWPAVLRSDKFQACTRDIEARRSQVLKELRQKKGVSAKSADGLLDAVRDLLTAIQDEESALMRQVRENGLASRAKTDWFRLHSAEEPIRVLLAGCYRLIEARKIEDVSLPPLDDKNGVTVERLMAYMHENNLYFNPSDSNGQTAYNMIFDLTSRYYVDLSQLKIDMQTGERRVEALRQEEAQIKEVMLGNKLNNFQQTEVAVNQARAAAEQSKATGEQSKATGEEWKAKAEQWKAIGAIGTALIEARRGF